MKNGSIPARSASRAEAKGQKVMERRTAVTNAVIWSKRRRTHK